MPLNLASATKQAIHSKEVKTFYCFELHYIAPDFTTAASYSVGQIVMADSGIVGQGDKAFTCIAPNFAPAVAPADTEGATYWELTEYPLCMTDWSETVFRDSKTYYPAPVKLGEQHQGADGKIQPVTLSVGNVAEDRFIQILLETYEVIGADLKVIQLFEGIDDPLEVTFKVAGAKAKRGQVDFTLSLGFDYLLTAIPGRTIWNRFCRWKWKDQYCKYADTETEECKRTWEDCRDRMENVKNFGGFPGVQNTHFFF